MQGNRNEKLGDANERIQHDQNFENLLPTKMSKVAAPKLAFEMFFSYDACMVLLSTNQMMNPKGHQKHITY